ncbi:MAG: cyclase family protein [Pseudomonadota bacterium]
MCHACVTEAVKARMLLRRELFYAAPAAAIIATAAVAPVAFAEAKSGVIVVIDTASRGAIDDVDARIIVPDRHSKGLSGATADTIPLRDPICRSCVFDTARRAGQGREAQVTVDDLGARTGRAGPMGATALAAMNAGRAGGIGADRDVGEDGGRLHYPGFGIEAAPMLSWETGALSLAADMPSCDVSPSAAVEIHDAWQQTGPVGIADHADRSCVTETGTTPAAGSRYDHNGASRGPARPVAPA